LWWCSPFAAAPFFFFRAFLTSMILSKAMIAPLSDGQSIAVVLRGVDGCLGRGTQEYGEVVCAVQRNSK
jgi:hypothetical protein